MNIIKKLTYILALAAVLFTAAGCSDPDDELTSVEYDRLFKPTAVEAKVQNKTMYNLPGNVCLKQTATPFSCLLTMLI